MTKHASPEIRKGQILDAAQYCFAERGYYETTMDHLAQAAQLSKGAIYWHFKNKRELFISLVERWFGQLMDDIGQTADGPSSSAQKLRMTAEAIEQSALAQPALVRAFLEFYSQAIRDGALRTWLREVYGDYLLFWKGLLDEGVERGEFRRVDTESAARLFMAYLDGALLQRELYDPEARDALSVVTLSNTLLNLLEVKYEPE